MAEFRIPIVQAGTECRKMYKIGTNAVYSISSWYRMPEDVQEKVYSISSWDATKWVQIEPIGPDGTRRGQVGPDGTRWGQMDPYGTRWDQMGPDGTRWDQM